MSDLASLRAEVSRLERINSELNSELATLAGGMTDADNRLSNFRRRVNDDLNSSVNMINSSEQRVEDSGAIMSEIQTLYTRFKNMELANKAIRECNNKIYYDFANYSKVRKIVSGILDNMNFNMISDSVIYKSVEKQHLQTPDYWLTAVLLSIMAWKNDDRELAENAMATAIRLDKKNSAVFYMLFNIRVHREDAALKWFLLYQECDLKGSDSKTFILLFSLLNHTVRDNIDQKIKDEVSRFIEQTVYKTERSAGFSAQRAADKIKAYFVRMKDSDDIDLNMVKRCFKDYKAVSDVVMSAKNNISILQFILDVGNVDELERNEYIDKFINDEIARPNDAEKSVYEDIEYNELIIACVGDVDKAKGQFIAQKQKKENDLDLIGEMIDWIYTGVQNEEINSQSRKTMFGLTGRLQKQAVDQYIDYYRRRVKHVHPVAIGEYSTEMNFDDAEGEKKKIAGFFEAIRDAQLSEINNIKAIVGAVLAAVGIAGVYFLGPACLILSGAGAVTILYNFLSNKSQRQHFIETCEMNIRNKSDLMEKLFEEYKKLMEIYREHDAYADRIAQALQRYLL